MLQTKNNNIIIDNIFNNKNDKIKFFNKIKIIF